LTGPKFQWNNLAGIKGLGPFVAGAHYESGDGCVRFPSLL
jgi:hypothetical protein